MGFTALQLTVRFSGLVQGKGLADRDPEAAGRHPLLEVSASCVPILKRVCPKPERADPETPAVELVQVEGSWWAAGFTEVGEVTVASQNRKALSASGVADGIEDGVHPLTARSVEDKAGHGGAVGKRGGPKRGNELSLGWGRGGPEHADAALLEQLNEQGAHSARRGVNYGSLCRLQRRRHVAESIGGEALHRKGGPNGEAEIVTQREERGRRGRSELRIGAAGAWCPERDPAPEPSRVHAGTEAIHDACSLVAWDPRGRGGIVDTPAPLGVGEVDADSVEADQNLAETWLGRGMSAKGQDLRPAQGVNDDGLHARVIAVARGPAA